MGTDTASVIKDALAAAVRAPSPYNTQPWAFEVDDDMIRVLLDRSRVLEVADPDAREARLACGAAVSNLRVAVQAAGRDALVDVLPDRNSPDLLATIRVAGHRSPTPVEERLARAIPERRTNRHPFLDRPVPERLRNELSAAARAEAVWVDFVDASARYDEIAELIRRAQRIHESDERYLREFEHWTGGPPERRDGVPAETAGPEPDPGPALALRRYHQLSRLPPRPFEQQPLLVAVLTPVSGPRYDVIAGAGMQRMLLTATVHGLSSSFISQPFEVPDTRRELTELFRSGGVVHALLRIGYGHPVPASPRRDLDAATREVE